MARRRKPSKADRLFSKRVRAVEQGDDTSLLDVVDTLLNNGVVVNGDVVLGLANVDLIYAKLSVLLSALDKIFPAPPKRRGQASGIDRAAASVHEPKEKRQTGTRSARSRARRGSTRNTD